MQSEITKAEKISAKILSYLFHPLFFPTLGLYMILHSGTYLDTMNTDAKNFLYMIVGFSTCILPLLSLPVFIYRKLIRNIEMEQRTERVLPLAFVLIFYFLGYYLLQRLPLPQVITSYVASATTLVAITLLITIWWKISFHTIGSGGLIGALLAISLKLDAALQMYILVVLLIAGIVSTARLLLSAHTPLQIIAGFLTGLTGSFLWMYFF